MSAAVELTWIDSAGTETVWTAANGYTLLQDPAGLYVPANAVIVEDWVHFDGASLVGARRPSRSIVVPLEVTHPTRVMARVAELATMLAAPGSLRWDDGTNTRTLRSVIYEGGLADLGDPTQDGLAVSVGLLALDPWWYGDPVTQVLPVVAPTAFNAAVLFNAVLPFNGGASAPVTNQGVEAFPVITITGPADEVTIGCAGATWQTAQALSATDVLVVDSRPGSRGPRLNGTGVDWSLLTEASRLWPLPSGTSSIIVGTVGSTGATTVTMVWDPRFPTP